MEDNQEGNNNNSEMEKEAMDCGDNAQLHPVEEDMSDSGDDDEATDGMDDNINVVLDNSEQTFEGHNGEEVLRVSCHPLDSSIAVSGGMDDKAYVWNVETGETLFVCDGHKDSVDFAEFNKDGTLVACGDVDGVIRVWSVARKELVWSSGDEGVGELCWARWHPLANVLLASFLSGEVWMWKVPSGEQKIFAGHGCKCTAGDVNPVSGATAAFGYADGSVRVVDLKTQQTLHAFTKGRDLHRGEVNKISFDSEGKNIATASADGTCKVINTTTGKVFASYKVTSNQRRNTGGDEDDDEEDASNSVECASLNTRFNLLAFGSLDCNLYIWNMRSNQIVQKIEHPSGIIKIKWDASGRTIFTACMDGICRMWNGRSGECLHQFFGAEKEIWDFALSKDQKWFLTASADGMARSYGLMEAPSEAAAAAPGAST